MYIKKYGETEECTVHMSKELARLCKPYKGDPRGPFGMIGRADGETDVDIMIRLLLMSGDNALRGADDDFVCIPQEHYESTLFLLKKMRREQKYEI